MIKAEISGVTILRGYTHEEKERIIEDTTLPNPAYENLKKYARKKLRYTRISPFLEYFRDEMGSLIVPRGYVPPFPFEIVRDDRLKVTVSYPKLHVRLRTTQREAAEAYLSMLDEPQPHGIIVLPTGKGKTILGLYLARKLQQRTLVVVHKDDLVTGWTKDCRLVLGLRPKQVGIIKGKEWRIGEQITVATVQTLSKLDRAQLNFLRKQFGMIIVDEFHHSAAKIYELVTYFPARYRIGLTATPSRNDGLTTALNLYFGKVAYEFVDAGGDEDIMDVTVKIRNVMIEPNIKLTETRVERDRKTGKKVKIEVKRRINIHEVREASLYDEDYLEMLTNDIMKEYKAGKSCIVFSHERDHIDVLYDYLISAGAHESRVQKYVGGSTSKSAKEEILRRAESKEALVTIATFHIATEGTNVKSWERAFLASSIANENDTIQAIGRVRRRKPGKENCIVYDYRFPKVPKLNRHGLVRDRVYRDRNFTVIGAERRDFRKRGVGRGFKLFRNR